MNNGAEATTNLTVRVNTLTTGGRLYQDPTRFTLTEPGGSFELSSLPGGGVQATRTFRIAANRPIRITESPLDGWELSDITCSLGLVTEVREAGLLVGMDLVVAPNESPVCSFSNTGDRARVTVVAATERDGAAVTSDQAFRIGGGTVGPFTLDTAPTSAIAEEATRDRRWWFVDAARRRGRRLDARPGDVHRGIGTAVVRCHLDGRRHRGRRPGGRPDPVRVRAP